MNDMEITIWVIVFLVWCAWNLGVHGRIITNVIRVQEDYSKNYRHVDFMKSILNFHGITSGKNTLKSPCWRIHATICEEVKLIIVGPHKEVMHINKWNLYFFVYMYTSVYMWILHLIAVHWRGFAQLLPTGVCWIPLSFAQCMSFAGDCVHPEGLFPLPKGVGTPSC